MLKAWHEDFPEGFLRDVLPEKVESVLDVGTGHGGVFDFAHYEQMQLKRKACLDIAYIRPDIPGWEKVTADASSCIPFPDNSFDVVQSTETMEHIRPDKWESFLYQLQRVSKDLVFLTTSDETKHTGQAQVNCEVWNPHVKFIGFPSTIYLSQRGYHSLFENEHYIKAFFRKTPEWNSRFLDMEDYVKMCCKNMAVESVIDFGTGIKGAVAEQYWEKEQMIKVGYAVDIFKVKYATPRERMWIPIKRDALDVLHDMEQKSVDVIQAFGFLEHLEEPEAEKFLALAQTRARKLLIVSAATFLHECDNDFSGTRKAIREGNPYHIYRSLWHWERFKELGFETNFEDMRQGISFSEEAIAWKRLG